jgi:transposase
MDLLHARCAGLDVHKDSVVACVRNQHDRVQHEVRTFGTTTTQLLELARWLTESGCSHAVLESTGVYWKPVWHVLAGAGLALVLANAEHVRNVPGRKTDVKDAVWLSDLLAHGLVTSSFVPPEPIIELRDLTRTRRQLVRQRVRHVQRIQKTLEDANIKLDSVISDVLGKSGRAMVEALIAGQSDPTQLVKLASSRLRAPRKEIVEALRGRVTPHHRMMLRLHLEQVDATDATIRQIDEEVGRLLEPFRAQVMILTSMPGVSDQVARTVLAEVGADMTQFATAAQLISWSGLCPQLRESAGKRKATRVRKGAPWLKPVLVQAAWSAVRKKDSYLRAQFYRLKARRGPKKAIIAVAASMLKAAYHMLRDGSLYQDLGPDHFDKHAKDKATKRLVRRLVELGYTVDLKPALASSLRPPAGASSLQPAAGVSF